MITLNETKFLLRAVLRWWWVMIMAVAFATGTAYYFSQREERYYVAQTSLMIGNTLSSARPDEYQLQIGWSLARFYGELARREPILGPVVEKLQLPFPWWVIGDRVAVNVVPNASLLELSVTDTSPDRAAALANAIGEQLITYSPTSPDKIQAQQQAVLQQLHDNGDRVTVLKDKIAKLNEQLQSATTASDIADINKQLAELSATLDQEEKSYNQLLFYQNNTEVNSLSFFERARVPTTALPSKRIVVIGSAGVAGLLMSFLAIFLLERLDRGWRGQRDLKDRFKMDNLGNIPLGMPMLVSPEAAVEERLNATREAQTNILLAAASSGSRTLMISSPQPSEGRTAFTVDLADLFGRSGHRVLIVDADFTSQLLTRMLATQGASRIWTVTAGSEYSDIWAHLHPTPLPNVALLPGYADEHAAPALIPSLRWKELVQRLLTIADVIIFDGPSAMNGPDAALLAPHVDGVVLALDPAVDDRQAIDQSRARLTHQKGAHLLGALTLVPGDQTPRRSFLRQLRGQKLPELPPARTPAPQASAVAASAATPQTPWPQLPTPAAFQTESRVITTPAPELAESPVSRQVPVGAVEVVDIIDESQEPVVLQQASDEQMPSLMPQAAAAAPAQVDELSANQKHALSGAGARRPRKSARPSARRRPGQHDDDTSQSA